MLIGVEIGMDPSTPVLLIRRVVLLVHALPDVTSANIYFTTGVISVYGVSPITAILGFFDGGKTEISLMVRQLNKF